MIEKHVIPQPAMAMLHKANAAATSARQDLNKVVAALFAALDLDGQLVSYDSETNEIEVERVVE